MSNFLVHPLSFLSALKNSGLTEQSLILAFERLGYWVGVVGVNGLDGKEMDRPCLNLYIFLSSLWHGVSDNIDINIGG